MSTIEPIGNNWGAKAAAGDAMERVPNEAPFIAIWVHPERGLQWSKANTDFQSLSMLSVLLQEFAASCIREDLNK